MSETKTETRPNLPLRLGQVVMTRSIANLVEEGEVNATELQEAILMRHRNGDWGDLCDEDRQANDAALATETQSRILSAYKFRNGTKFWVITEWDRSVTTALLPEDY